MELIFVNFASVKSHKNVFPRKCPIRRSVSGELQVCNNIFPRYGLICQTIFPQTQLSIQYTFYLAVCLLQSSASQSSVEATPNSTDNKDNKSGQIVHLPKYTVPLEILNRQKDEKTLNMYIKE